MATTAAPPAEGHHASLDDEPIQPVDMKEKHRLAFNNNAFIVDDNGEQVRRENSQELTDKQWKEIIRVVPLWGDLKTATTDEETIAIKAFRALPGSVTNKKVYRSWASKYVVRNSTSPLDGSVHSKLYQKDNSGSLKLALKQSMVFDQLDRKLMPYMTPTAPLYIKR